MRMRNVIRIAVISVLLLLTAGTIMATFEIDKTYYYDSAFTMYAGWDNLYCDTTTSSSLPSAHYRIIDTYRCSDGSLFTHTCQEQLADGSWSPVTCPF